MALGASSAARANLELGVRDIEMANIAPGAVAIAAGDAVEMYTGEGTFGTGLSIRKFLSTDPQLRSAIVGGALQAIPVGGTGLVRVEGWQESVNIEAGLLEFLFLRGSTTVDGQLTEILVPEIAPPVAYCPFGTGGASRIVRWLNPLRL